MSTTNCFEYETDSDKEESSSSQNSDSCHQSYLLGSMVAEETSHCDPNTSYSNLTADGIIMRPETTTNDDQCTCHVDAGIKDVTIDVLTRQHETPDKEANQQQVTIYKPLHSSSLIKEIILYIDYSTRFALPVINNQFLLHFSQNRILLKCHLSSIRSIIRQMKALETNTNNKYIVSQQAGFDFDIAGQKMKLLINGIRHIIQEAFPLTDPQLTEQAGAQINVTEEWTAACKTWQFAFRQRPSLKCVLDTSGSESFYQLSSSPSESVAITPDPIACLACGYDSRPITRRFMDATFFKS